MFPVETVFCGTAMLVKYLFSEVSGEVLVFHASHLLNIFCGLVLIPTQMKCPMEYHPMKFIVTGNPIIRCVLFNPVNTYIDLTGFLGMMRFADIEGYNVCMVIMFEELLINIQQLFIAAEDIGKVCQSGLLLPEYPLNKYLKPVSFFQGNFLFKIKMYSHSALFPKSKLYKIT